MKTFLGYHRPDGSVGIRNIVVILSLCGLANPLARRLAQCVKGCVPVLTPSGRGQVGDDKEQLERTLKGLTLNPNVAAVLVVNYDRETVNTYLEELKAAGKPAEAVTIAECNGGIGATEAGMRILTGMVIAASAQRREPAPLSALTVALECGGSDPSSGKVSNPTLGAVADRVVDAGGTVIFSETVELLGTEEILAKRASTPETADQIRRTILGAFEAAKARGVDIKSVNPVPENIQAGLKTLEEKSLGALMKTGNSDISGVLQYAEKPSGKGLYFMNTPFFSVESLTGMAAAGAQVTLFSTGVGNNIATSLSPALKVTGNSNTGHLMGEHIDADVSAAAIPSGDLGERANKLEQELLAVCSGKLTTAEVLDETELSISRLGPSV